MLLAAVEEMGATISGAVHRWGCCATRRHGWPEPALSSRTGKRGRLADFLLANVADDLKAAAAGPSRPSSPTGRQLLVPHSRRTARVEMVRLGAVPGSRPWCALCTPRRSSAGAATAGARARRQGGIGQRGHRFVVYASNDSKATAVAVPVHGIDPGSCLFQPGGEGANEATLAPRRARTSSPCALRRTANPRDASCSASDTVSPRTPPALVRHEPDAAVSAGEYRTGISSMLSPLLP